MPDTEINKAETGGRGEPKRALVLSFSDLRTDPRVRRQFALLCGEFEVTAVGSGCPGDLPVRCLAVPAQHWSGPAKAVAALLLAAGRYESAYWSSHCVKAARNVLQGARFDLIIANDIWTLPLALELKGRAKVLLDAHEYAPLEFEESWRWRFFFQRYNEYLCRRYLPLADAATTVCEGIAEEYRRTLGVRMTIVHNAPPYRDLQPSPGAPGDAINLVHHGGAIPSRQLETMVETMRRLDGRYSLDFVLVPSMPRYLDHLKSLASGDRRIRFLPPVGMHDLPRFLNRYDAGVYLLPPNNFNNRHSLPNKFFDFVQARLAIAVGPSPEMARLVRQHGMGLVAEDFTPAAFAAALGTLTREMIAGFKARAHAAARELCFEKTGERLRTVIHRLLEI